MIVLLDVVILSTNCFKNQL